MRRLRQRCAAPTALVTTDDGSAKHPELCSFRVLGWAQLSVHFRASVESRYDNQFETGGQIGFERNRDFLSVFTPVFLPDLGD